MRSVIRGGLVGPLLVYECGDGTCFVAANSAAEPDHSVEPQPEHLTFFRGK